MQDEESAKDREAVAGKILEWNGIDGQCVGNSSSHLSHAKWNRISPEWLLK